MPARDLTAAGITESLSGVRKIPQSRRPDGTMRKERLIRPGFVPEEDQPLYVNPLVQRSREFAASNFGRKPEGQQPSQNTDNSMKKSAKKNAKRKAAKKKNKELDMNESQNDSRS